MADKNKTETDTKITLPQGYQVFTYAAGIKYEGRKDLGVLISARPASYAGVFTTNRVQAAPVKLCRERLGFPIRALVVNTGSANACTGEEGEQAARRVAEIAEAEFALPRKSALSLSTGVIGTPLPLEKFEPALRAIASAAGAGNVNTPEDFARAIMTTDTVPKMAERNLGIANDKEIRICGFAKGAGMISPQMATMLAFIITDLDIRAKDLQCALLAGLGGSFNAITVDGDMSTNDSVILLANGASETRLCCREDTLAFREALAEVMQSLALQVVRDGEGATKLVTIEVTGARNTRDAELAARAIANSLLVKTAFFGNDPNWGRIIDVAGYSGARLCEEKMELFYLDRIIYAQGRPLAFDREDMIRKLAQTREITIRLDLGVGRAKRTLYTTDLSYEYVKINAEYTS
ncbi:MAG: bifunctional glutamate N-acetyltransferase/amino-acid acetyltransferase ArgJ [Spirochaetota bacterium]|jgi:glutamate N-acetyltransferase/amino-acid N-acetyltransferase|nr:bifunctional glutamate N-acetyltransferase/amino-acid acetyltransferase ArgJ [Spirochaetota bacterium]